MIYAFEKDSGAKLADSIVQKRKGDVISAYVDTVFGWKIQSTLE